MLSMQKTVRFLGKKVVPLHLYLYPHTPPPQIKQAGLSPTLSIHTTILWVLPFPSAPLSDHEELEGKPIFPPSGRL